MFEITSYPYPDKTVRDWSEGIGCGRKVKYTPEEFALLEEESASIKEHFINEMNYPYSLEPYTPSFLLPLVNYATNTVVNYLKSKGFLQEKQNFAILSAGAPGVGKSVLLESIREQSSPRLPFVDPKAILKRFKDQDAQKWRPAAHYLAIHWAASFVSCKSSFYFAGAVHRPEVYEYFKARGYRVKVIHLSAPDEVRQTTEKGNHTAIKIIIEHADQIEFYYRNKGAAIHAATWVRGEELKIHDLHNYHALVDLHQLNAPKVQWPFTTA